MDKTTFLSYPDSMKLINEAVKKDQAIDKLVFEQLFDTKDLAVKAVNKLLFDTAEKQNVSLYTLCYNTIPDITRDWNMSDPKLPRIECNVTLKPMPFDFEHDGGYWKNKYYELKKQIQEIINEPIHTQQ